jgi:glycosyltransferase involved in cell wall biosynthesis
LKKNIIFFLPNFDYGGASKSICNTIINLDKKKYNLYVYCLNECKYKKELEESGINVIEIKSKKTIFSIFEIKYELIKIIRETKLITIFISNINYANVISLIFLSSINNLKIITVDRTPLEELNYSYSNLFLWFKNLTIKFLMRKFYNRAFIRVGNSKTLSRTLSKFTNSKFITIYPFTIKKIINFKKKSNLKKKLNIMWVGRFTKEKSFNTLINAAKLIKNNKIIFNIFGYDKFIDKYLIDVKKLRLDNFFKFWGYVKNLKPYYKKNDVYISTSIYEGFQNSMVEAINYNLPIISANSHGGIKDILNKGKYGVLFKTNDHIKLASLINSFRSNQSLFIKKSKLAKINLKRFNFESTNKKYEQIFDSIKKINHDKKN